MPFSTYSFTDLAMVINHPDVGSFTLNGQGVGDISFDPLTEKSAHDVGNDGNVMVSKIKGNNAQVTIQCQQTSELYKYLLACFNASLESNAQSWAGMTIFAREVTGGSQHEANGVSFQKKPTKSYGKQGQMISWVLMAAEYHEDPV